MNHEKLKLLRMMLSVLSVVLLMITAVMGSTILNEGERAKRDAQMLLAEYDAQMTAAQSAPSSEPRTADNQSKPDDNQFDTYVTASSPYRFDIDGYFFTAADAPQSEDSDIENPTPESVAVSGYTVIGKIAIKKLGVILPIISETSDAALKVSICRYQGTMPGKEPGNLVITGHNYANGAHFGRLDELTAGDQVVLYSADNEVYIYQVYDTEVIAPDDFEALKKSQDDHTLMLLTCSSNGTKRLLVRCRML